MGITSYSASSSQPKGYPACGCIEIMTVGLQDSIVHKDTEALFSEFLYYRLLQIMISKASILVSNKVDLYFNSSSNQ